MADFITTTSGSRFSVHTGLSVLVNTSFNVYEEPIVNTPAECGTALLDRRIDFVMTKNAIYELVGAR